MEVAALMVPIMRKLCMKAMVPGGVAILLDATTDNKNRTAGDFRHLFDKYGGNLGETGCVVWMFEKNGLIIIGER